jgi:hypothetical protein
MSPTNLSIILVAAAAVTLAGYAAAASEPSESQMKEAMLYSMNHPDDGTANAAPIAIKFFKKEGCDAPTPRGYNCFFHVVVSSTNIGASFYNDVPSAMFYQESGKWIMRAPF